MKDNREKDRRKKKSSVKADRRKGPRRLVCGCGGKIEVVIPSAGKEKFICLRCGKNQ